MQLLLLSGGASFLLPMAKQYDGSSGGGGGGKQLPIHAYMNEWEEISAPTLQTDGSGVGSTGNHRANDLGLVSGLVSIGCGAVAMRIGSNTVVVQQQRLH